MADAARADALRNYQTVLDTARAAFAEHGSDVSLREVARQAGVGIGTLYRHFPTREALLEAVVRQGFDRLRALAEELADSPDSGAALYTWAVELGKGSMTIRGLPGPLLAALNDESSPLHASCLAMRSAAATLLDRAQQARAVRADITPGELFALVAGAAWAAQQLPGEEQTERLVTLTLDGIRPA